MKAKKCLILGGNGFIGSHLAESMLNHDFSVRVIDRCKEPMNLSNIKDEIEYIICDLINEKTKLRKAMENIDILFLYHTFSTPISTIHDPINDIKLTVIETLKIIDMAGKEGIKKIIFPSSGGTVYGDIKNKVDEEFQTNPTSPYGISKLMIEKYLEYYKKKYDIDYKIVRYSNVYGEKQNPTGNHGIIPIFLNKIINNEKPLVFGDGSAVRDYIYVKDAISATVLVALKESKFDIYNIGSGKGYSIKNLIDIMSNVVKRKIQVVKKPEVKNFVKKIILDNNRICKEFNWSPDTTINKGIEKTWRYLL